MREIIGLLRKFLKTMNKQTNMNIDIQTIIFVHKQKVGTYISSDADFDKNSVSISYPNNHICTQTRTRHIY